MTILQKLKQFYRASAENRRQLHLLFAFLIIPLIGMSLLYVYVNLFWL